MEIPLDPALSLLQDQYTYTDAIYANNTFTPDPSILTPFVQPGHAPLLPQPAQHQQQQQESPLLDDEACASASKKKDIKHKKHKRRNHTTASTRNSSSVPVSGARNGTSWTEQEVAVLQDIIDFDLDISTAFDQIGRTTDAVKRKWRKMLVAQEKRRKTTTASNLSKSWPRKDIASSTKSEETSVLDTSDSDLSDVSEVDTAVPKRRRQDSPDDDDSDAGGGGGKRQRTSDTDRACNTCRLAHKRCDHPMTKKSSDSSSKQQSSSTTHTHQQASKHRPVPKKRGPGRPRKSDLQASPGKKYKLVSSQQTLTSDHYIPRKRRSIEDYEFSEAFVKEKLLDADQLFESPKRWSARPTLRPRPRQEDRTPHKYLEDETESAVRSTLPGNEHDAHTHSGCEEGPLQPCSPHNNTPKRPRTHKKRAKRALATPISAVKLQTSTPIEQRHFLESPDHHLKQPFVHGDRFLPIRPTRPGPLSPLAKPRECALRGYVLLSQLLNPEPVHAVRARKIAKGEVGCALDDSDPFACGRFAFSNSAVRDDTF